MIGDIKKFRFWCQKVIPLVYDNSLSYYEVLCKVVYKLNEVIADVNEIPDYINQYIDERLDDEHIKELIIDAIRYLEDAISTDNEEDNTNFSKDYSYGALIWWNNKFYKVIRNVDAGDSILDSGNNPNIEEITFSELFNSFIDYVKDIFTSNDEGDNANASRNYTTGEFLWHDDLLYEVISDIEEGNSFIFSGDNANVSEIDVSGLISEIRTALSNVSNNLSDEITNRENADTAILNKIGELGNLNTTDKSTVVGAINDALASEISRVGGYQIDDGIKYQHYYEDLTGSEAYIGMQGACYNPVRNTFVIGFLQSGELESILVEVQEDLTTVVQRVAYHNGEIRHCNDMTYNTSNNKIYIAGYTTNSTNNSIIEINPIDLSVIREITLPEASDAGHAIGKIAYDAENDQYVTTSNYDIMIYNSEFELVKTVPFELQNFAIDSLGSITFRPLQSIEVHNNRIYGLYTVMSNTSASASVVVYNYDGVVENSYPISCYIIGVEAESISSYKGKFKIIGGGELCLFSTNFNINISPEAIIGKTPYQTGLIISNTDINDIKRVGCFCIPTPSTVAHSPFVSSYDLYVIASYVGVTQIAIKGDGNEMFAIRRTNYVGAWHDWDYYPRDIIKRGDTKRVKTNCNGMFSATATELTLVIPIGEHDPNVATGNLTVNSFDSWIATVDGILSTVNNTTCTVTAMAFTGPNNSLLEVKIKKNDSTAFTTTGGTPVNASVDFTISVASL